MSTINSGRECGVSAAQTEVEESSVYAKVTRRLLPLLVLGYAISYLDRVNVSFAKLQMASDLHLSDTLYGLGAGIFFVGYFFADIPSNLLLHRFGARRWIARILVTWGLMSGAMAFASSPTTFYCLRFLLGIAEAGFFPGVIYYLMQWFPSNRRGSVTSIFYLGIPVSGLIGGPLSGFIISRLDGFAHLAGWRWMFLIEALPAVILGGFVFGLLEDRISSAKWLSASEKALLEHNIATDERSKVGMRLREVFTNRSVWLLGVALFLIVMGMYGIYFWLPTLIKESGVRDPLMVGLITAIPNVLSIIVMLVGGRLSDRKADRRRYLVTTAWIGAAALIISVHSHTTAPVLFALTISTSCSMTMLPIFFTFPPALLHGRSAAAGIALINSLGVAAGFVAPYMTGALRDFTGSPAAGMYVLATCWVIAGALAMKFPERGATTPASS
jgi:sugar phosphate permease